MNIFEMNVNEIDDAYRVKLRETFAASPYRLKEKENPDIFSGRVYTGLEAKNVGLIDDFGSIYSVARDVVKAPELVNYTPEDDLIKLLSGRFGAEVKAKVEETLADMLR